jgi:type IV secretory pathway TrbF-like protein
MKPSRSSWAPEHPLETPHVKARQEWDLRIGSTVVQAKNWRLAAFAELGLLLVSMIGLVYLGAQPKAVPLVVQVDKLGAPTYVGPLDQAARDFKPTGASLQYHLRRFVDDTRSISSDAAVLKRNWLDAYKLVTPSGANQLNAFVHDANPFKRLDDEVRVSVQVNVTVPLSHDTWQVDWTETTWDQNGNPTASSIWRGNFRILLREPESEEDLAANPLGLFIDEFHWARLQDTGRTTTP